MTSTSYTARSSGERGSETAANDVSLAIGTVSRPPATASRSTEDGFSQMSTSNASSVASGSSAISLSRYTWRSCSTSGFQAPPMYALPTRTSLEALVW